MPLREMEAEISALSAVRRATRRAQRRIKPLGDRRVLWAAVALVTLLTAGTAGYVLIEGWPWFDAFYMTVITLATIGYSETRPLSVAGRVFTILLIFGGLGVVTYLVSNLSRVVFEGWFGDFLWRSRVKSEIEHLDGHYIVCGCGRVGELVRRELMDSGAAIVVVENEPAIVARLGAEGTLVVQGDATLDDTLTRAGVHRAAGLVAALSTDAENAFVTMTARDLNPTLPIVSRANDEAVASKLRKAGASRVVSPNSIGGRQMAQALLIPEVLDFLQIATARGNLTIQIEQVLVGAASELIAKGVGIGQMRSLYHVTVVALRRKDGPMFDMPGSQDPIEPGDTLILAGRGPDCQRVSQLARG